EGPVSRTPDVWFPRYRGAESTMTESCCSLASSVPGPESRTEAARLAPIPAEAALRRPDLRRGVSVAADHGQEADSEETDLEGSVSRTPDVWFPRYRGAESTMTESCCSLASSVPGPESRTEAARLAPIPAEAALRRPDLRRGVSVAADHGQEADSEETDHEDQPHQPDGNADVAHDQAGDRLSMTVFAGS